MQAQLDEEQSRIAAMRAEVGARRARLDELQTTYAAKREMVSEAQMQWSKRSASCATQVALGSNGASGMRTTCSQPGEEAPSLGVSLRRAMGEVCMHYTECYLRTVAVPAEKIVCVVPPIIWSTVLLADACTWRTACITWDFQQAYPLLIVCLQSSLQH